MQVDNYRAARSRQPECIGNVSANILKARAQPRSFHFAVGLRGLHNARHHIGRNGKTDADRAAGFRKNGRVDTQKPPIKRDQRTARIARINRRIGLNE